MELVPPFMHAVPLYPFSVKTRLRGLLRSPSLDNCTHARTHMRTHTTFNCCGELDYSHYGSDSSATVNDICVINGGELCGELLILRCAVFYGLINKSCSASRCRCLAPITIHPQPNRPAMMCVCGRVWGYVWKLSLRNTSHFHSEVVALAEGCFLQHHTSRWTGKDWFINAAFCVFCVD